MDQLHLQMGNPLHRCISIWQILPGDNLKFLQFFFFYFENFQMVGFAKTSFCKEDWIGGGILSK